MTVTFPFLQPGRANRLFLAMVAALLALCLVVMGPAAQAGASLGEPTGSFVEAPDLVAPQADAAERFAPHPDTASLDMDDPQEDLRRPAVAAFGPAAMERSLHSAIDERPGGIVSARLERPPRA